MRYLFFILTFFQPCLVQSQDSLFTALFQPDSIRHIVEVLASDSLEGRYSGSAGNTKAALFIAEEFSKAGLKQVAGMNGFFMPVPGLGSNIIGVLPGKSKRGEVVVFSAHYDHVGTDSNDDYLHAQENRGFDKGDKIYNGANDDASGVSAVISLARYFAAAGINERTILFIAFTGEELGLKGSGYAVENFSTDSIIALINIEMIGRAYMPNGRPYMTGSERSKLWSVLNSRLFKYDAKKYRRYYIGADPFPNQNLFQRSDNYPFSKKGIAAHTIMVTSPEDEFYHSRNDEAGTLDYALMSEVIETIAIASSGLVNGEDSLQKKRRK